MVGNAAAAIQAASGIGIIGSIRTQQTKRWLIGKLRGRAARGLATLPFRSGDVILRELQTSKGILDVAAEAQVVGRTLHLKDIAVFPRGAEALSLGTREVMALRTQLAAEARVLGFDQLRITGTRITWGQPGQGSRRRH